MKNQKKNVFDHLQNCRYFGLKSLVRPIHNNFVPIIELAQADVLLNPVALLLCYYTSVIFLRDIHRKRVRSKLQYAIETLI